MATLVETEDRPWSEWKGGKLSTNQLAKLLRAFGIVSGTIRASGDKTMKGYKREQFVHAWKHYLPEENSKVCDGQNQVVTACDVSEIARNANETATCDVVTAEQRNIFDLESYDDIPF